MADLAKIQFLRSTVAGKTPTTSQLADGELAINMADYAIYTKNGSSIVQLAGKGIPETNTKKLTVNGPSALNDTVTVAEGKTITFTNADLSGGMVRHITGKNALNDGWYIGSGGESNKGFLEIGTIDDGDEEIRFVSRGSGDTIRRTLKLIDSGGNTRVPGNIYIDEALGGGGSAFISKNKAYFGAGGADIYMRNTAGGATNQLTITDGGELLFQAKPIYWDGRKPTLTELGIGRVENARQLEQDNFPVITGNDNRWIKVALLKDPGSGQSRLQLMVTNGGNYGSARSSIDFIDCSARSIPSTLTSSNIRSYLQIRRLGDPSFDNTNQMRYSLVRTSEGLELWFTQRAFIGGVKVALLSIAGGAATEYYLPTGYTTSATAPEGLVESVAIRIYDEMNKPNLDDGTDGILSVAKGGTGASTASAARTNLGLGTAATRDVGTGSGQVMLVGAYGLGGKGTSYSAANARDYLKQLRTDGSQFMRNTLSTDINYGMGASFYSSVSDVHAVISVDWATGRVKVGATNDTNLNSDTGRISFQELYGTAFKPTPDDVGAVARAGDTMTGNLTIKANLKVENPNGSMIDLGSENSDKYSRLTLARKVGSGAAVAMLKITPEGYVQFGYQTAVSTPAPSKYLLVKSSGLEVEGDLVFNQTYRGTEDAVDITDKTNDLNNMVIKGSDLGTRQLYKCVSSGGGSNISNKPTSDGNFVLEVLSLCKISDNDWTCKQTFTTKNGNVEGTYVRYCQNGTWSAWKEVVAGVQPINLGGTGATSVAAARNNLGVGEGQSVTFGGLNVNGKMTVGGEFEAQNSKITGNLNVSEDNRMIVLGKNSDIGLVKKIGMPGKMAISKSNSFTIMVSTNTNNQINPADTFNDIFKVDANGNQTVYGNAQINRQLTVSSAATVNGVINANGGIIVPTTKYVQIADAPTQNNQATNKKYVDDKVASAISNAGDTYLPLAGGTVTGRLTITGDQLKTTSLWVTGDAAVNGVLTVDGRARFNQEFSVSTSVNVQNNGNSHVFFRKADGTEKGLLWVDDPGNVSIRAGGVSGPVWNFWNSGSCQFPGAISNFNGVNSTTNYPGGGIGAYLNTAGLTSRFSNGAYVSLYFQEYVGNYHQAILNVNGYGQDNSFYFRAGGDFICTRNGSFDNVEIRSDRRAKSDIKVIENALEKVEKLTGNTYELHNTSGGTTRSAGLIAQEVQEVLPEAVTQDIEADGGLLRLNYNSVIALLVESVKELSAEVKELKSQLK